MNKIQIEDNDILTTKEVVQYFRVAKITLLKMVSEGRVRAFKVGNAYRYKKSELEEDLRVNIEEPKAAIR